MVYQSYSELLKFRHDFKAVKFDTSTKDALNRFDEPGYIYFRVFFYFNDDNGLLGLSNMNLKEDNANEFNKYSSYGPDDVKKLALPNTAFSYLLLNDEKERGIQLKRFVNLLSNISQKSPWYFKEIGGLDAALERKMFEKEFKVEEERKTITITCLEDAYDQRIGTLLDLYRSICYSYQMKREVLPANLRKFNMGILLFSPPYLGKSGKAGDSLASAEIPSLGSDEETDCYISSTKFIELRNCEFDYNSGKTAWATINNDEPMQPKFTITIHYDDAYESRYNEVLQGVIGDFINRDLLGAEQTDDDIYKAVFSHGDTMDGSRLQLENHGESYKDFWTDRNEGENFNKNVYGNKLVNNSFYKKREIVKNGLLSGTLSTLSDRLKESIKIPSLKRNDNIHDYGTVTRYGIYEYTNRVSGMNGMLGGLAGQSAGLIANLAKTGVKKLVLGNINGFGIGELGQDIRKVLSGDYTGVISDNVNKYRKDKQEKTSSVGKKLPGYDVTNIIQKGNQNLQKSAANNL